MAGKSDRRLTLSEFNAAIATMPLLQPETVAMVRRVLVDGVRQKEFVSPTRSKAAVCQAVARVWRVAMGLYDKPVPPGYVRITAVLPDYQAFLVKQWERQARRTRREAAQ